jgi:Peptidase family M23
MKAPVLRSAAVIGTLVLLTGCSSSTESATVTATSSTAASSTAASSTANSPTTSSAASEPAAATPMLGRVLAAPVPVPATDGTVHLAYELNLTNALGQEMTVESVTVKAGDRELLSLSGKNLAAKTRILGAMDGPTTTFGPAQSGVVWLDVVIDSAEGATPAVPEELSHTVVVNLTKPMPPIMPATMAEDIASVTVSTRKPAVIAPPLDGPNWLSANSCCDIMTSHRMALNPLNGELWAAERFAIDYLQFGEDGTVFRGDGTKNESFPFFGDDIYAVADGPVVSVLDGLPEQIAGTGATGLKVEEYGGNHVVQDIGGGNYAFYAHLKTGSVKVKPGDQLTTGQVLGNLGNSGNTDAPHLHFHVMNGPDFLRADGLPFVFDSFKLDGRMASNDDLGPLLEGMPINLVPDFAARDESNVSPMVLDVMTYDLG